MTFTYKGPKALMLLADERQISQAVVNVIKNAIEALEKTKHPKIDVTLSKRKETAVIKIKDNGKGFDDTQDNLLKPYYTHKKTGTGLGLAIVARVMEEHGGTLKLETKNGAVITMTLPFKKEEKA